MPELRPCRDCGTIIEAPATVCSDRCYSEVYGAPETDDRRAEDFSIETDEQESEEL